MKLGSVLLTMLVISSTASAEIIMNGESLIINNPEVRHISDKILHDLTQCEDLYVIAESYRAPAVIVLSEDEKIIKTSGPFIELWNVVGCNINTHFVVEILPIDENSASIEIRVIPNGSERNI